MTYFYFFFKYINKFILIYNIFIFLNNKINKIKELDILLLDSINI